MIISFLQSTILIFSSDFFENKPWGDIRKEYGTPINISLVKMLLHDFFFDFAIESKGTVLAGHTAGRSHSQNRKKFED